jgi:hypothetical protein
VQCYPEAIVLIIKPRWHKAQATLKKSFTLDSAPATAWLGLAIGSPRPQNTLLLGWDHVAVLAVAGLGLGPTLTIGTAVTTMSIRFKSSINKIHKLCITSPQLKAWLILIIFTNQ